MINILGVAIVSITLFLTILSARNLRGLADDEVLRQHNDGGGRGGSVRPKWPCIDWSNLNSLNEKDSVYRPDTELMC